MPGIDEYNFTLTESSSSENFECKRSGPIYVSTNGTGTITLKTGAAATDTDGPTIRYPDDSGDITLSSNQGVHLLAAPKYLIVTGTNTNSPITFTANVHISF